MTRSQAWKFIALAFFKRAAKETLTTLEEKVSIAGFCNAIIELDDAHEISGDVMSEMKDDVSDVKYTLTNGQNNYVSWPYRDGNRNRPFRGVLALLISLEAKDHEAVSVEWQTRDLVSSL